MLMVFSRKYLTFLNCKLFVVFIEIYSLSPFSHHALNDFDIVWFMINGGIEFSSE